MFEHGTFAQGRTVAHWPTTRWRVRLAVVSLSVVLAGADAAAESRQTSQLEVVGEAFGQLVRKEEFAYYDKTAAFLTRTGKTGSRTDEEIRQEAWQDLILLKEATRLGITVDRSEVIAEITRLLKEQHISYGSKDYVAFVGSTMQEDAGTFERRVEDVLRINILLRIKKDPPVTVTDEEVAEKFSNERNSFESEYIHFDTRAEAEAFLAKVRQDPAIWRETFERKRTDAGQKGAAWINIMTVEALIDLWKIPKEDAAKILQTKEGDFVVARNDDGDAVFRVLQVRHEPTELDEKKRAELREAISRTKKYRAGQTYLDELLARAQVRDYEAERKKAQERRQRAATAAWLNARARIRLQTTQGDIELTLWPDVAPKACENFLTLIERGSYDGLTFHRVIKDFMIQGGDPKGDGTGGESMWGKPFEDEVRDDVTFDRPGLLAMANSGPDTNASQFFLTAKPTPWLNGKHTIFGEVVSGLDVLHKIEGVPADSANKPLEPQKILKASIQPTRKNH